MKNISAIKSMIGKGLLLFAFFSFTGCLTSDENLQPSNADAAKSLALQNMQNATINQSQRVFTAHLKGQNEVPAVQTTATGQATFKLSSDGTSLSYKLIVANIENVTQAHIHCGAEGVSGPPVAFLFGFNAEGVTVNGVLAEGTITSANVIAQPDSEACMGGVADFDSLVEKILSGEAYVNVHTVANPGGEIRGQIR